MLLTGLPLEMLDKVASCIDDREGVLSFGLSSKRLYSIVSKSHLQYCDIRVPLSMPALWARLSRPDDMRASLIRSLTILHDEPVDSESFFRNFKLERRVLEEYAEEGSRSNVKGDPVVFNGVDEGGIIPAVRRMINLRQFRWLRQQSVVVFGGDNLWTAINSLPMLKDLHVVDLNDDNDKRVFATSDSFQSLRGFSSLTLTTAAFYNVGTEPSDTAPLVPMLTEHCPDLQSLDLNLGKYYGVTDPRAGRLLQDAKWRSLRVLHMKGMSCNAADLSKFLCCHPTIEDLQLPEAMPGPTWDSVVLVDDALPNLHVLKCHSPTAAALLKNPKALRCLRILSGIDLDDTVEMEDYFTLDEDWYALHGAEWEDDTTASPWKARLLEGINAHPTITSIGSFRFDMPSRLVELAGVTPSLTKLSMEGYYGPSFVSDDEWADALSHFVRLEHLGWAQALDAISSGSEVVARKVIRLLLSACPNLRTIDARGRETVIIELGTGTNSKKVEEMTSLGKIECNGNVHTAYVG
ncbi:hypothetical protein NEOLEDRAFT_1178261 [Neolentinus lepideus HHB14362 ss-1]|uniref:F-box domain-containing protein n=1 Tax=Neolentinus lepideus HHB14362 ss-1 TaxID=1314782 RepID=A0A165SPD1_9AGAM|nr:hypothetical protein NEOLEDRAFT_1178261 [Neolentinus lepideus HHB14362 ss-1]